jgi:hypothetical protein
LSPLSRSITACLHDLTNQFTLPFRSSSRAPPTATLPPPALFPRAWPAAFRTSASRRTCSSSPPPSTRLCGTSSLSHLLSKRRLIFFLPAASSPLSTSPRRTCSKLSTSSSRLSLRSSTRVERILRGQVKSDSSRHFFLYHLFRRFSLHCICSFVLPHLCRREGRREFGLATETLFSPFLSSL